MQAPCRRCAARAPAGATGWRTRWRVKILQFTEPLLCRAGALPALHTARTGGRNWVADALARNAASRPTWPVYRMLDAAGGVQDSITCAGAHHAAQALAGFLTGPAGLRPGDRAVLCYPPGALLNRAPAQAPNVENAQACPVRQVLR